MKMPDPFGPVSREERQQAELFFADLVGRRRARRLVGPRRFRESAESLALVEDAAEDRTKVDVRSREERRQADLFFADLMGRPRRRRLAWPEDAEHALAESGPLIEGPLTDSEWRTVIWILSRGEAQVGAALTDDADRNALLVAARLFCDRNALRLEREDPLLCLTTDVTVGDRRVRGLVPHVTLRGPIVHWPRRAPDARILHVMTQLVRTYGYPINGAAGLVGNLQAESGVLPQRVEGSAGDTPLRAQNFAGVVSDFTADDIMNRSPAARTGPRLPGIGLAQWTSTGRRAGLFAHAFRGMRLGARVLFDMDAQVDYLVTELRGAGFAGVQRVLTNPSVTIDGASDEVVYNFEVPGALLEAGRKLPRTDARVIAVFDRRRPLARSAERIFTAAAGAAAPAAPARSSVSGAAREVYSEQPAPTPGCPLPKGSAIAYFFKGPRYVRYDIPADKVAVGPKSISESWRGVPEEFQANLDAAVNWGDGHAYLFKKARYLRYNLATDRVDLAPTEIARNWPKLPEEFQSNLDAAVNWGDGTVYFFKKARYLRYNIAEDRVDVGPTEIARYWPNLPTAFQSDLDSVVLWGDGNAYFFKEARYLRYNIAADQVDVGPEDISRYWPKLPAAFQSGIKAAVNWTHPGNLAEIMRAAGLTVKEAKDWRTRSSQGQRKCFTPIGIIMHHTVTPPAGPVAGLADIVKNVKANFFVDKSGVVTVVSGGRANHAGYGAQQVLDEVAAGVAPSGTALARGLQDGPIGNGHFYGFENDNKGDGVDPWPEVQIDAMARGAAALCQRHGWGANRVIAHAEWTSNKFDPKGIDMNDFRARVAALF